VIRERRGQFVLLAAVVVVTALVAMLAAYAQLGPRASAPDPAVERTTVADAKRVLERSVAETTTAVANNSTGAGGDGSRAVARAVVDRLRPAVARLESSGSSRGVAVAVERNDTAATRWIAADCPYGPARRFGACVVTDGVVTQPRANDTVAVAVAFDVTVRGPRGTVAATFVIRGVRGAVADATPARPSPTPE
jgi:hypothetical protein